MQRLLPLAKEAQTTLGINVAKNLFNERARKTAVCLLLALTLQSVVMSGVCFFTGKLDTSSKEAFITTLDVCGHGGSSLTIQGVDTLNTQFADTGYYFPSIRLFPPTPVMPVASTEPGKIDIPPKA